jgi:putative ATP-dependent endonuclease of OLD family
MKKEHNSVHTFLALEEPEAHLHPHAQRALYSQVQAMPAQVVVSTHSSYFASQAQLGQLRLFRKDGAASKVCSLDISKLSPDDVQNLKNRILMTRGDLLFSSALLLFEGETEEAALPIFAESYWGNSIHQLGLSFVPVGGGNYFPFIWLAESLGIPWFILSDAEPDPLKALDRALSKAGFANHSMLQNVITMDAGNDFEAQLVAEGYAPEIEAAFNTYHKVHDYISEHIRTQQGQKKPKNKGGGLKDFSVPDGRKFAILDALYLHKTSMAVPCATGIAAIADANRCTPPRVRKIFDEISAKLGWAIRMPPS